MADNFEFKITQGKPGVALGKVNDTVGGNSYLPTTPQMGIQSPNALSRDTTNREMTFPN
jgi:hypothetical protein